jgi:hypothetical protein
MIINLSSNGQTSHSNFINQFTDNIVIKPNSKICLTRVSLVRDGKQTKITIPAGTTMSFRYTPYDVITQIINATDTTYTADTLTDRLNALFGGLKSFNYTFEARATDTGENIEIEFTSYLDNATWQNTTLQDFIFTDGDKERQMNIASAKLISGGTIPTGNINSDLELRSVLWSTSNATAGFGAKWGNNYTVITNQGNKNAFNMYNSGGNQFGSSFITIVNPTFTSSQEIRIGPGVYDDVADDYSLIPIPGNLGNNNWYLQVFFGASNNNDIQNGLLYMAMYNNETETHEIVDNGQPWYCGDTIEIYVDGVTGDGTEPIGELFTFNAKCHSRNGLIGWIPSGLSGTKFWNVETPSYMSPADYWMKYRDDLDSLEDFWDGNKMYGARLGRGIDETQIVKETVEYRTTVGIASVPITYSSVPVGLRGVGNFPFYRAYTSLSGISNNVDIGCHTTIGATGLPIENVPTLFTCVFQLVSKAFFTTNTIRTLFAGPTQNIIKIDTAGTTFDLEITEKDGTNTLINLVDGAGVRIVFNNTSNYFLSVKSYGFSINPQVDIIITDLTNNVDYTGTATLMGSGMDNILHIGGNPGSLNNTYYLHGYLGDFRFYQKPVDITGDITYWNNTVTYLKTYYDDTGLDESEKAYFGANRTFDIYTDSEKKYGNYGSADHTNTMTPAVMRIGGDTIYDPAGYNFSDIFFFPMQTMPDANRDTSLSVDAYNYAGVGIVSSNELNDILDIKDYDETTQTALQVQTSPSGQDTIDNPIFSTKTEVEQIDIEDKIFNIQIKNLPHRNYNGAISNFDKTIYQIGSLINAKTIENQRIIEIYPPQKVFTNLDNAGDLVLNQLEVAITDELNITETDLKANTNLTVEIL